MIFDNILELFDGIVAMLTVGAIIVAVAVNDSWRSLLIVTVGLGAFGVLVIAAGQPEVMSFPEFFGWLALGTALSLAAAVIARLFLVENKSKGALAYFRKVGDIAKVALAPRRWPEAAGKPPATHRELTRRCTVAIAAGAGGVIGSLMSLDLFWNAFLNFNVTSLFHTIVLTAMSMTLMGPLHETVMNRGLAGGHRGAREEERSILDDFTWVTVARIGFVALVFIVLDLAQTSLATCVKQGKVLAMYQIVLGGLVPGLVTYYWSAAVQLGAPSVMKRATWPSIAAGTAVSSGLGMGIAVAALAAIGILRTPEGAEVTNVWVDILLVGAGTLAVSLAISFITCGVYALAGGFAIDRVRQHHCLGGVFLALMIGSVPPQLLVDGIIWAGQTQEIAMFRTPSDSPLSCKNEAIVKTALANGIPEFAQSEAAPAAAADGTTPCAVPSRFAWLAWFSVVLGAAGWFAGLWVCDFPDFVRRPKPATPAIPASLGIVVDG